MHLSESAGVLKKHIPTKGHERDPVKKRQIPSSFFRQLHRILADENISTRLFEFFFSSLRIQGRSAHLKAQFIPQQKLKEDAPPSELLFFPA